MAATLRPETMYGQVNCWVLPDGQYAAFVARARPYVEDGYEPGATQVGCHPIPSPLPLLAALETLIPSLSHHIALAFVDST